MGHVKIVVEEEQRHDRVGLDHDCAAADLLMRPVLGIGAHHRQRIAPIGDKHHILPERHAADRADPQPDHAHGEPVQQPRLDRPAVPRRDQRRLRHDQPDGRDRRPEQEAAEHRIVDAVEAPEPARRTLPGLRIEIERFGVGAGLGQVIIVVMLEVQRLVAAVGEPQGRRREHQQLVHQCRAVGMAVQGFMLQRAVERHQIRPERCDDPPAEGLPEPDERAESDPPGRQQPQCLPFNMGSNSPARQRCAIDRSHF